MLVGNIYYKCKLPIPCCKAHFSNSCAGDTLSLEATRVTTGSVKRLVSLLVPREEYA